MIYEVGHQECLAVDGDVTFILIYIRVLISMDTCMYTLPLLAHLKD
jgi:hypothetical protein